MTEMIHKALARKFEAGSLRCRLCGATRPLTRLQVGRFFAHGWPECCHQTMSWDTKPLKESK